MLLKKTKVIGLSILMIFSLLLLFYVSCVTREITGEDKQYIGMIVGEPSSPDKAKALTYSEQIAFIRKVQRDVLSVSRIIKGIPYGTPREPKDLYQTGHGLCFDRSWVIEKILASNGFAVRHVAVYDSEGRMIPWLVLFIPGNWSHALSEVETHKGWVVVDSLTIWVSLDKQDEPVPLSEIQKVGATAIEWGRVQHPSVPDILKREFVYVYGLFSRHGYFSPPYVPVPDIIWADVMYNFYN